MNACAWLTARRSTWHLTSWKDTFRRALAGTINPKQLADGLRRNLIMTVAVRWMDMPRRNFTPMWSSSTSPSEKTAIPARCNLMSCIAPSNMQLRFIEQNLRCDCDNWDMKLSRVQTEHRRLRAIPRSIWKPAAPEATDQRALEPRGCPWGRSRRNRCPPD